MKPRDKYNDHNSNSNNSNNNNNNNYRSNEDTSTNNPPTPTPTPTNTNTNTGTATIITLTTNPQYPLTSETPASTLRSPSPPAPPKLQSGGIISTGSTYLTNRRGYQAKQGNGGHHAHYQQPGLTPRPPTPPLRPQNIKAYRGIPVRRKKLPTALSFSPTPRLFFISFCCFGGNRDGARDRSCCA